jgi:hypothetical protein
MYKYEFSEDHLQAVCAEYLALRYPNVLAYHVPNGGNRSAKVGARLKKHGVKRGVPDWCIDEPRGKYHGARIELKVKNRGASPDQKFLLNEFEKRDYFVAIVKSFDQFKIVVDEYLGLTL